MREILQEFRNGRIKVDKIKIIVQIEYKRCIGKYLIILISKIKAAKAW